MAKRAIFDKKNILVTGGAGFIGSHLCDELVRDNKVICIDDFSTGDEKNIDHLLADPNFSFIKHDVSEPIELEKLPELKKFKIEFQGIQDIYHLACPTSPANFDNNKIANILALSYGTKNIMDLAVKYQARVVHFSSSVVYGGRSVDEHKVSEDKIGQVDMNSKRASYDEGKRFAETIVSTYRAVHQVDAKVMRLFRTYGPRMKLNDGHLIPDFIFNALDNKDLEIPGNENFASAFCYVSDVVDAALKLMEAETPLIVNVGSDVDINLSDLAQKIFDMLGAK
jgi:UDP-glucuronate decarboxylase